MSRSDEANALLKALGWSKAELARRVHVHPNTVSNWFTTGRFGPGVLPYLRLVTQVKMLVDG
jgi:transcriptional regulator with XRE-family HTH domain